MYKSMVRQKIETYEAIEGYHCVDKDGNKYFLSEKIEEYPENPRKAFDNTAKFVCHSRKYNIGDEGIGDVEKELIAEGIKNGEVYSKPLYIYDHSGVSLSTRSQCMWDSSRVGTAYVFKSDLYCNDDEDWKEKAEAVINSEIEEYSAYLNGDVYIYTVLKPVGKDDWEEEECTTIYGSGHEEEVASSLGLDIVEV